MNIEEPFCVHHVLIVFIIFQFDDSSKSKATENKQENAQQDKIENLQDDTNEIFGDEENFDVITGVENEIIKYATHDNFIPSSTDKSSSNKR